jgi:hypothetical protein
MIIGLCDDNGWHFDDNVYRIVGVVIQDSLSSRSCKFDVSNGVSSMFEINCEISYP